MDYKELSEESKKTIEDMVYFCINNGYCMGMDEGLIIGDESEGDRPKPFRKELELFCGFNDDSE